MNFAHEERQALSELLEDLGPEASTLCKGWKTSDLSAHLVLRDRRPDAAIGILAGPLAGYTERVRKGLLRRYEYPALVRMVREGPPAWSPVRPGPVDAAANSVEYFVHHEDVRRAQVGWEPRELPAGLNELLWKRLSMARLVLRKVPAAITLVRPDDQARAVTKNGKQARVHGPIGELTLWALGRTGVARVKITGEAEAVEALQKGHWRF